MRIVTGKLLTNKRNENRAVIDGASTEGRANRAQGTSSSNLVLRQDQGHKAISRVAYPILLPVASLFAIEAMGKSSRTQWEGRLPFTTRCYRFVN